MEVHGRDTELGAYRVSVETPSGRVEGLVPEDLMPPEPLGAPRHQHAYEWLARHRKEIEAALRAKREGRAARAPFDRLALAEET